MIRALIVLLVVLNLGVAAWWVSRPEPLPPPPPVQPAGVTKLKLLSENRSAASSIAPALAATQTPVSTAATTASQAAPALVDAATAAAAAPALPAQCFSVGPFANQAAASAAGTRLGNRVSRSRAREVPGNSAQGYNVLLPPQPDREAAQALAQRIGAAGFDDYLVVNTGAQANGIALGRYRSREAAERRQAAMRAAGFEAQLQPLGNEGVAQWWLDIAAAANMGASALQTETGVAQSRSLDCALLR